MPTFEAVYAYIHIFLPCCHIFHTFYISPTVESLFFYCSIFKPSNCNITCIGTEKYVRPISYPLVRVVFFCLHNKKPHPFHRLEKKQGFPFSCSFKEHFAYIL